MTSTTTQWIRHRFHADPSDPRPVEFPPPGPCWTTGYGDDYATVVAYLPLGVEPSEFWPEASNIESEEVEAITFSSRFPCPEWWGG